MVKKIANISCILTVFFFITCIFTYPAIFHIKDRIIGSGYDNYQMLGWQYVAETQIEKGVNPLSWTYYWRYPVGIDFSRSFDSIFLMATGLIMYRFIADPVMVFNLSILFIVYISNIFAYLYFEKISKNKILAILGSIIYNFSFYTIARIEAHANLLFTGCFPFFAFCTLNLIEKGSKKNIWLFILSINLVFISSLFYIQILIAALIFLIPLSLIFYRASYLNLMQTVLKNKIQFSLGTLFTLINFYFLFSTDIVALFTTGIETRGLEVIKQFSAFWSDFLFPGPDIPLFIKNIFSLFYGLQGIEHRVFLGYVEIFLFVCFVFSKINRKLKLYLSIGIFLIAILSLGCKSYIYPYCYLYSFFPFKGVAEPSRYYVILYLLLTTAIILFLGQIIKLKNLIYIFLLALVVFERIPSGFYLSETHKDDNFIKVVREQPAKAVLDLPIVVEIMGKSQSDYDLYSVYYQKPIVNSYIHWRGNTPESQQYINFLTEFKCFTFSTLDYNKSLEIAANLKANGINIMVFHKKPDVYQPNNFPNCDLAMQNIYYFLYMSPAKPVLIYDDTDTAVFKLN